MQLAAFAIQLIGLSMQRIEAHDQDSPSHVILNAAAIEEVYKAVLVYGFQKNQVEDALKARLF